MESGVTELRKVNRALAVLCHIEQHGTRKCSIEDWEVVETLLRTGYVTRTPDTGAGEGLALAEAGSDILRRVRSLIPESIDLP